jgi:glycosyltransferase involved in cell wall biosynthesis
LSYLGSGLAQRGHAVTLWLPAHPRMDELAARCARFARIVRADYRNTYDRWARSLATCFNRGESGRLARDWRSLDADVVHVNKQNLEDGLDLLRAAGGCARPSVCTIHLTQTAHYLRARAPGLRDWIARRALSEYPGILVAVHEARRAALAEFIGERVPTRTIPNGVPLPARPAAGPREAMRRQLGVKDGEFLVLAVGRLEAQKQPLVFLETARRLHQLKPEMRFLWIGDGAFAQAWTDWVARENLGHAIRCAGWQADALPYLLAGDLLLHVASYEGFPLALVEAMGAQLPCAVRRPLGAQIGLRDGQDALLFENADELARRLGDAEQLRAMAAGGRRLVEGELSYDRMLDAYEALYREVASG